MFGVLLPYPTRDSLSVIEIQMQIAISANVCDGIKHRPFAGGKSGIGDRALGTDDDVAATFGREFEDRRSHCSAWLDLGKDLSARHVPPLLPDNQ